MSRLVQAKRIVGLLVLLMAAVVALSGPIAEVLDPGSEPVAEAKKKHKHKKHKKKKKNKPRFNVVQCPTDVDFNDLCFGTEGNDFLIGGPEDREPLGAFDEIHGREGNDVFSGGNGSDNLFDESTTSSDVYLFPSTEFGADFGVSINDDGGDGDIAGLSSYSNDDFEASRINDDLKLDGPEDRDIVIRDFFDEGKIEYFLFREGYFTGDQVASGATAQQGTTPQEQAALKERLHEAGLSPSGEPAQQQEDASS